LFPDEIACSAWLGSPNRGTLQPEKKAELFSRLVLLALSESRWLAKRFFLLQLGPQSIG